jgi:14-3-3 protein epsilon
METKIFMARVADQAERYEDMVNFLKEIMNESSEDLNVDVRNLLSVGFKNLIGSRRAAWRTVSAIEQNKKYEQYSSNCAEYKAKIETELAEQCESIIKAVNDYSVPKAESGESKTFYLKMIGDYYRYIAECVKGDKLAEVTEKALEYYDLATEAAKELATYNSTRLGLALNFSVFYYELKNDSKRACELA